jgi:hypothetical protein
MIINMVLLALNAFWRGAVHPRRHRHRHLLRFHQVRYVEVDGSFTSWWSWQLLPFSISASNH